MANNIIISDEYKNHGLLLKVYFKVIELSHGKGFCNKAQLRQCLSGFGLSKHESNKLILYLAEANLVRVWRDRVYPIFRPDLINYENILKVEKDD